MTFRMSFLSSQAERDAEILHEALTDGRSWPLPGTWKVGHTPGGRIVVLAEIAPEKRTRRVRTGLWRWEDRAYEVVPTDRAEEILRERWPFRLPVPSFSPYGG